MRFDWPQQKPRIEAARIAELPTREARTAALLEIPEPWRGWVRELVEQAFMHRRSSHG